MGKEIILAIIFIVSYLTMIVVTYGHAYSHEKYESNIPMIHGMYAFGSATLWPMYWSRKLQE